MKRALINKLYFFFLLKFIYIIQRPLYIGMIVSMCVKVTVTSGPSCDTGHARMSICFLFFFFLNRKGQQNARDLQIQNVIQHYHELHVKVFFFLLFLSRYGSGPFRELAACFFSSSN